MKRILALRPDSKARVTAELARMVAKGPKPAKRKWPRHDLDDG